MPVKIFFCYAHEDEPLLNKLKAHLKTLQRQGLIDVWHDRDISAGTEWEREINEHLNNAQIILLLISPDFMNSDYCYGTEMKRALERNDRGEATVIPIILRPVYWQIEALSKLLALPRDAKPVKSWSNLDKALFNVAEDIRKVVEELSTQQVKDAWENVKRRVRQKNSKVAAMLNGFRVVGVGGTAEEAIIVIQATYELHYKYLQEGEHLKDVSWALSTEFGQRCQVRLLAPGQPYFAKKR